MRKLGILFIVLGLSTWALATETAPELGEKAVIRQTRLKGKSSSQKTIVKIEDEVDGKKVVCYGIAGGHSLIPTAIDCLKLD